MGRDGRRVGYARVSTEDQSLALQLDALRNAGCEPVFHDGGISGSAENRPALDQVLAILESGDVLVVWKLDRLGRSLSHLIGIVGDLGARGIGFRSLSEAIDTTTAGGRLTFHIMGALAEFERALISERTKAGMAAAKARGAHLGRPRKLTRRQLQAARRKIEGGKGTPAEIAASYGVAPLTLARALRRSERRS